MTPKIYPLLPPRFTATAIRLLPLVELGVRGIFIGINGGEVND